MAWSPVPHWTWLVSEIVWEDCVDLQAVHSSELQMGIILKAGTCYYPTFDQIYDMSNEVINVINKT